MEGTSFDHADIAAETEMTNERLKFEGSVNHNSGLVAAMARPKDITEYMVRVVCDRLETWGFCVCSLKCQSEMAKITLQSAVDRTRRVKTSLRNIPRYSHDRSSHCESAIKEVEQIRVMIFRTLIADHKCDRDRYAAWTNTRYAIKADEQTSFFKLMSKDYHSEVAKFSQMSWFRSTAKQSKLTKQWKEAHRVGKLKRAYERLLVIKGSIYSDRASRRKSSDEQLNLDSVKAVLSRPWELKASTELHTAARQKYIMNQVLDKRGRPLITKCALGAAHSSECRDLLLGSKKFEVVLTAYRGQMWEKSRR